MKKHLLKISGAALTFMLAFTSGVMAKAEDKDAYKETAEKLIAEMGSNKHIENKIDLYDVDGNVTSVLYDLNDGYVIVDKSTNEVSEFSLSKDSKYFTSDSKHYIYAGALNYYEKISNGKVLDLKSKFIEDESEVQENLEVAKDKFVESSKEIEAKMPSKEAMKGATYTEVKVKGTIPNWDYNPNGVCGSCASANLLTYYSYNVDRTYVPSAYRSGSTVYGTSLVKSIIPYIEGSASVDPNYDSPGSSPSKLKSGLTSYISKVTGHSDTLGLSSSPTTQGKACIGSNKPFVLGLYSTSGNPYGDHWVVGISYKRTTSSSTPKYFGIIDGWGSNDVYVNASWTDYVIWDKTK